MDQYQELNRKMEQAALDGNLPDAVESVKKEADPRETELLHAVIHPEEEPPVIKTKDCSCSSNGKGKCEAACLFEAIRRDQNGNLVISNNCTGCGDCIDVCAEKALAGRKDSVAVLHLLRNRKIPVYAMIAPAFTGQFSPGVTAGKLRSAFKRMGFYGMVEVALFADILTLKEALEFDRAIKSDRDFLLTSCCCPLWVALIRKSYQSLIPHVPPSVSPMVACGRSIKRIHPEAKTVFIGPCLAKKAEARQPDIADAVDYVLTFEETAELFDLLKIHPETLKE